jgi:hypothetical protein
MNEQTNFRLTKEQVVSIPNIITDATITKIEVKPAIELFGDKAVDKNQMVLVLSFESKEYSVYGTDIMTYYSTNISDRSKLGKLLSKYGVLEEGTVVQLERDSKTEFYKIRM